MNLLEYTNKIEDPFRVFNELVRDRIDDDLYVKVLHWKVNDGYQTITRYPFNVAISEFLYELEELHG
jgi:hypothetical protein